MAVGDGMSEVQEAGTGSAESGAGLGMPDLLQLAVAAYAGADFDPKLAAERLTLTLQAQAQMRLVLGLVEAPVVPVASLTVSVTLLMYLVQQCPEAYYAQALRKYHLAANEMWHNEARYRFNMLSDDEVKGDALARIKIATDSHVAGHAPMPQLTQVNHYNSANRPAGAVAPVQGAGEHYENVVVLDWPGMRRLSDVEHSSDVQAAGG